MNITILFNILCSTSIILAAFYCIVRTRFVGEFIRHYGFGVSFWKWVAIIATILAYILIAIDIRLLKVDISCVPHSMKLSYTIMTYLFVLINILVWKVILHYRSLDAPTVSKIGGRPRRKKRPIYRVSEDTFHFHGMDETMNSIPYLFNSEHTDRQLNIISLVAIIDEDKQRIQFSEPISGELHEITIEFE